MAYLNKIYLYKHGKWKFQFLDLMFSSFNNIVWGEKCTRLEDISMSSGVRTLQLTLLLHVKWQQHGKQNDYIWPCLLYVYDKIATEAAVYSSIYQV